MAHKLRDIPLQHVFANANRTIRKNTKVVPNNTKLSWILQLTLVATVGIYKKITSCM